MIELLQKLQRLSCITTIIWFFMSRQITCENGCNAFTNTEFKCELQNTGSEYNVRCSGIPNDIEKTFFPIFAVTTNCQLFQPEENNAFSLGSPFNQTAFTSTCDFYNCFEKGYDPFYEDYYDEQTFREEGCYLFNKCAKLTSSVLHDINVTSSAITNHSYLKSTTLFVLRNLLKVAIHNNDHILLTNESFLDSPNIQYLNLSSNALTVLPNDVFQSAFSLKNLDLSHNKLSRMVKHIFIPLINVASINLSHNSIEEIEQFAVYKCSELKIINLAYNKLSELSITLFRGLYDLLHIDLSHNKIVSLPNGIFNNQLNLYYLDISHNKLVSFLSFFSVKNLRTLLLNNNAIRTTYFINLRKLKNFENLEKLDLSENQLNVFSLRYFPRLLILNLSQNKIQNIDINMEKVVNIRIINLSRNELQNLTIAWKNIVHLENIDFAFNNLTSVTLPTNINNTKLMNVSFQHNQITNIHLPEVTRNFPIWEVEQYYWLSNNPLNCDCKLFSLYTYIKNKNNSFPDSSDVKCSTPYDLRDSAVISLPEDSFVCPIAEHCPEPCKCGIRGCDYHTFVNCSSTGLNAFPNTAPFNTTVLYFQRNKLVFLNSLDYDVWGNLYELRLDENFIESIEISTIPQSLRKLTLTGNRIKTLSLSLQNFISSHEDFYLMLGNNKQNCNCNMTTFKAWILKNTKSIQDLQNVTCEMNENGTIRTLPIYQVPDSALCPNEVAQTDKMIIIIITTGILIIFILLSIIFYYKFKQVILPFFYVYCPSILFCYNRDADMDESKPFDAFIAYSSHDREIVMELINELETKDPYFKLCIHERDWMPGNFISQNIVDSIANSKRTLLILTERFVSSAWFEIEVRTALFQMLEDKINRLVVIVVEKCPDLKAMANDVRHIIQLKTYLVWEERWFWEKLRYVMPHKAEVPSIKQRIPRHRKNMVALVESNILNTLNSTQNQQEPVEQVKI